MTDPLVMLRRLQVSLVSGWMPPDVARWLSQGVDAYLEGRRLESALGLKTGPGKPNPAARMRLEQRDELVCRMVRGLPGGPWEQAGELVKAIAGVNTSSMQAKYLAEAVRLKMDIPVSQRQLYRILSGQRSD